jgi:hypothetical protein
MTHIKITTGCLVLTLVVAVSGAAAAGPQYRPRVDADGRQYGASLDPRAHGYEHAYRDGADRGRFDREHGVRYNLKARDYNNSTRGYEPFMGSKGQYQQGYREGYTAGYDSAFRGQPLLYGEVHGRTEENRNRWEHKEDPYASRQWGATDMALTSATVMASRRANTIEAATYGRIGTTRTPTGMPTTATARTMATARPTRLSTGQGFSGDTWTASIAHADSAAAPVCSR